MSQDRVDGWKEISNYLGKGIRTVQRWERERNLPIYRLESVRTFHRRERVFAFRSELDRWMKAGGTITEEAFGPTARSMTGTAIARVTDSPISRVSAMEGALPSARIAEGALRTSEDGGLSEEILGAEDENCDGESYRRHVVATTLNHPSRQLSRPTTGPDRSVTSADYVKASADHLTAEKLRAAPMGKRPWYASLRFLQYYGMSLTVLVFVACSLIFVVQFFALPTPNVAATTVESSGKLVALASDGKPLWTKQFQGPIGLYLSPGRSVCQVADIDGDHAEEVLFAMMPEGGGGKLFCFDKRGALRWEYLPGARLKWNGRQFNNNFRFWDFSIRDFLHNGKKSMVVIANHQPSFPSQVSVLDHQGRRIGEYWHTGYIFGHECMDVDQDGTEEIILAGINDVLRKPFIAAIKYDTTDSISPVPTGYAPGLRPGNEVAYLTFPNTDVGETLMGTSRVRRVANIEGGFLTVSLEIRHISTSEERVYYLDRNLRVTRLDFPQSFIALHHQLYQEGKLDHELNEKEKDRLMRVEQVYPYSQEKSLNLGNR